MRRRDSGISLLEVLIALAVVMLVLYAAITFFIGTVRQYKVQTKIIETNVEGILGLELFRRDLESLGFGLHWNDGVGYSERSGVHSSIFALNDNPAAPRAVASINGAPLSVAVNGSDYLVIRSASVGMAEAAGKWTTLQTTPTGPTTRTWGSAGEDLVSGEYVTVIAPGGVDRDQRVLVNTEQGTDFSSVTTFAPPFNFTQPNIWPAYIVYGIDNGALERPFNRAEYYIDNSSVSVPPRCAANTGVLLKAVVRHDPNGTTPDLLPLLDCVADMQIVYGLDADANPNTGLVWSDDITGLTAEAIRAQLKEIRVHVLAQEGQRDPSYTHAAASINVGSEGVGRPSFDVSGYRDYRWKIYTIVVRPRNLAN